MKWGVASFDDCFRGLFCIKPSKRLLECSGSCVYCTVQVLLCTTILCCR